MFVALSSPTLALPPECDPRLDRLGRYWGTLAPAAGVLPGRQHFDPVAVAKLWPFLWLFEVHRQPLRFRYRYLGTEHVIAMERESTGHWVHEVRPELEDEHGYALFVAAAERGLCGFYRGAPTYRVTPHRIGMERLILPLARGGSEVDLLLGITVYRTQDSLPAA